MRKDIVLVLRCGAFYKSNQDNHHDIDHMELASTYSRYGGTTSKPEKDIVDIRGFRIC
jgi:hypothetical protein